MHVLPGDSLVEIFKATVIEGEIIVCRECLIDGDVQSNSLEDFWRVRENYLSKTFPKEANFYAKNVKREFEKLVENNAQGEINLWFEYELFCQTNMWFCLSLLKNTKAEIYRVQPIVRNENDIWRGFGGLEKEDLQKCFESRTKFSEKDLLHGKDLWEAYRTKDFAKLRELSEYESECFPKLKEVCQAEIEKQDRPQKKLREIISTGETNFGKIFQKFNESERVYGFGDLQVERIYNEIRRQAEAL